MSRIEVDALGHIALPDELPYGIQTYRAVQNFAVSGKTIADIPFFVTSIATIKKAAAQANHRIGALPRATAAAIVAAVDEILNEPLPEMFPVDVFQGGGGTSSNMNLNEVIARRANLILAKDKQSEIVDPNNHVNLGQSTNDVIPTALKMAIHAALGPLIGELRAFINVLRESEDKYGRTVKLGRTCLQDALPITFGQQISGYRSALVRSCDRLLRARQGCLMLPLGATAIGTQFGTAEGYLENVYASLCRLTGEPFVCDPNFFDGLQNADAWLTLSADLKALALSLSKFANDLRLMSSGPRGGLAELELPAVQPGSSIMPGKINPVIPEMVMQVYFRVLGNDSSVTRACEGELDLNVWESLIINCVSESIQLITNALPIFGYRCVKGIKVDAGQMHRNAQNSLAMSTVVSTMFDYQQATLIAKQAAQSGISVEAATVAEGLMNSDDARIAFNPLRLTDPKSFHRAAITKR